MPAPQGPRLEALHGKHVVVTGGTGFIGARVVRRALDADARVTVLARPGSSRHRLPKDAAWDVEEVDLFDPGSLGRSLRERHPDIVMHLAAIPNWRQDPTLTASMISMHVVVAGHLLEAARLANVRRVVLFGSAGEYGPAEGALREDQPARPVDPYSATKLAATELALMYHRSFGLACTVVRPFVVYGPGESEARLLPSIFAAARAGRTMLDFTPGEQVRDFVHVDDVAEGALFAALEPRAAGEVLNLGTGTGHSVRQAIEQAIATSGGRITPHFGALPYRPGEPARLIAEMTKTRDLLGWSPSTSLGDGLRSLWEF
jgi:nucleoside-diphosphate-sugar epimerase